MESFFEKINSYPMLQIVGIGLILSGLYYYTLYDDGTTLIKQISGVQAQIQTEEARKKDTEATLKEEASMKASVAQLSQQYQEVQRRLPSTLLSIDINKSIDVFAKDAGVSVKNKKPLDLIKKEIADEVPVEVTLEGNYSQLAQFIYFVSSAEKMSRVKNFTIRTAPESAKPGQLKFEGQIIGYKIGTASGVGKDK